MASPFIVNGELMLYGPVGVHDFWDGDGFTAADVVMALAEMSGDITARLNSGGGIATEGAAIYNALLRHDGQVTIVIDGIAASAASLLAMAGDRIEMPPGSLMMIHEPSGITIGKAADHRATANVLDTMSATYADVYARRTGLSQDEILQMMKEETWFTPQSAVEKGFADAEIDPAADATASLDPTFDFRSYLHAPEELATLASEREANGLPMLTLDRKAHRLLMSAAAPLNRKEPIMATTKTKPAEPQNPAATDPATDANQAATTAAPAADVDAAAITASANSTAGKILVICEKAGMSIAEAGKVIAEANGSLDKAREMVLDFAFEKNGGGDIQAARPAHVTADAKDRFSQGAEKALLHKVGLQGGEVNEFTSMSLRELARMSLDVAGIRDTYRDGMALAGAALGMGPTMAAGQHSTSDFATILANVAYKSMMKGYDEAAETFQDWTSVGQLSDFKIANRIDLNLFPSLAEVPEGAEYSYAKLSDRGVTVQLATYGKKFAITRQAIINDDANAFSKIPLRMGRASRRTIGNLVYAVLTANAAMADGKALFHADHANLASSGAAPSASTVGAGRTAMRKQTDPDSHASGGLNISPSYLLVPVELQDSASVLMAAEFDPGDTTRATARTPNPVRNAATVISDARLSTDSATAWYLAADPAMFDTIEVSYLDGVQTPVMEQQNGWDVDGVEFKVRIDAGVTALDYRGLYKNAGS